MKPILIVVLCIALLSACTALPNVMATPVIVSTKTPAIPPTKKPTATETPARTSCRVNSYTMIALTEAASMNPPRLTVKPSGQKSGLCRLVATPNYDFLFPADWEVTETGGPKSGYSFSIGSSSDISIFVWGTITKSSLKTANLVIDDKDEILQEKTTLIIRDKQTLVTLSTRGDRTIKRYFIYYPSNIMTPGIFVFQVIIPTVQVNKPEFQELLKAVEAMVASFKYVPPETGPG